MTHSFLLEIGVEEMPAHVVTPSVTQLAARVSDYLADQRISFQQMDQFATPRRLALLIHVMDDKQPDIDTEVKGPAKKIAQDADGNWTKAAIGFSKGQGASVDDITFKELKGTEYVYIDKHVTGKPVTEVLTGLKEVIMAMNFPTMMKWSTHKFEFVRPIKWLVALLDDQVIPFSILNITTGNVTNGHRFLGGNVTLKQADDYEVTLQREFVIANQDKRKQLIQQQIETIAADNRWQIALDPDLLEEVNNLVEWPTAFAGQFDEKYLDLPDEVLITSMKDHQRFFYARDQTGKLLPDFISVRNGNTDHIDNVVRGNERVLTARLEDAQFFYQEDQQYTIDQYVNKLKNVSFHDKISSMYDKMQRASVLANVIGKKLNLSEQLLADLDRASHIYKFDLTTGMVGEFAELQGVMGEKYALLQGEKEDVATAVREHYLPISAEGDLPTTTVGAVLAIADKLDSIISFFAVDLIPSGSNDPYALRRQAFGIVRIIAVRDWHLPLLKMEPEFIAALKQADILPSFDLAAHAGEVRAFVQDRIKQWFTNQNVSHDIVDAVVAGSQTDIANILAAANVLSDHKDDAHFKDSIEALTRVLRIAKKGEFDSAELTIDSTLFEHPSEQQLFDAVAKIQAAVPHQTIAASFEQLTALRSLIENYFDENMIMDKNEAIRDNRLKQLSILARLIFIIGNLDDLVVK